MGVAPEPLSGRRGEVDVDPDSEIEERHQLWVKEAETFNDHGRRAVEGDPRAESLRLPVEHLETHDLAALGRP
jgi:hypothetical protein